MSFLSYIPKVRQKCSPPDCGFRTRDIIMAFTWR